jgi:hypothetical protein
MLHASFRVSEGWLDINGLVHATRTLDSALMQLSLLFPHNFPCVPPMVLCSSRNGELLSDSKSVCFPWGLTCLEAERLAERLVPAVMELVDPGARLNYLRSIILANEAVE